MTLLINQSAPEFDRDPALEADDKSQPVGVEFFDNFLVLTQYDVNDCKHCTILIERRDLRELLRMIAEKVA